MTNNINDHFQYWDESLLAEQELLPRPKAHRYLCFDIDQGGLNNIRLVFEYVVVLAAITGRTLVLPPKCSWYLINNGPIPEQHFGGVSQLSDFYDIDALARAIPVISTEEFIEQAHRHLSIPDKFRDQVEDEQSAQEFAAGWKAWLGENTEIPGWNPYDTVIAVPNMESAQSGPHNDETYLDGRSFVEFTAVHNAAPVLHFPSNEKHRSLGPVATMLASNDEELPMLARRLLKNHVRLRTEIFDLADDIIRRLGLSDGKGNYRGCYDALQIRRNDFQYKQTQIAVETICSNISSLIDQNLPVYVATDESREAIFVELQQHLVTPKVLSWRDVEKVIDEPVPFAWIGPVEQLICTPARRFVGTDVSTFTAYIHRLRGYLPAPDTNVYYHSESYSRDLPKTNVADYRGRDYLREHPLLWQSC